MAGVYTLRSQSVKSSSGDTTYNAIKLMKIYTGDHYMYAGIDPSGIIAYYGIGTYTAGPGIVTERNIFNAAGAATDSSLQDSKLLIEKSEKGFTQKNTDASNQPQPVSITESYEAMSSSAVSALDGCWRENQFYAVKGNDTTYTPAAMQRTEYKVFYKGHFIFGITFKDNTKKNITIAGYGVFSGQEENKIKQVITVSNNPRIVDPNGLTVAVEMDGPDEFRQITEESDGTRYVSFFKRIK